jgi:hypothetical protein
MTIRRWKRSLFVATTFAALGLAAREADAAPPWVNRGLTLPAHDWAFDVGFGLAHDDGSHVIANPPPLTAAGFNFEFAVGLVEDIELGVRTGVRLTNEVRVPAADEYGRLWDRQTFGTLTDVMANPEVRLRGRIVHGTVAELALEGRVTLPIEQGSDAGVLFGMPLLFHVGRKVRFDTGFYVPIVFYRPTYWAISLPFQAWFQVTPKIWLGPHFGVKIERREQFIDQTDVEFGFGFGYQIARWVDLKTMFLFPHLNHQAGARDFGAGVGFQLRIE